MMKKHALLVQAHKNVDYFVNLAKIKPTINIYIHFDKKSDEYERLKNQSLPDNIYLITDRVVVNWGGFSQILATLILFETAFANHDNGYFHLLSGEDILLQDINNIEQNWGEGFDFAMMLSCEIRQKYAYRLQFDTIHADKLWQRQFFGKVFTKYYQLLSKIFLYQGQVYFGSQWFSVTRQDWEQILPFVHDYKVFFEKKLVPDEHFFQTIVKEKTTIRVANDNKRLIIFDKNINRGNSPIYLSMQQLQQAKLNNYWFARKVSADVAMQWLQEQNS